MTTVSTALENSIPALGIKGRFTYLILKLIIWILGTIPDFLFKALCNVLYLLSMLFAKKQKRLIKKNIDFAYKLPAHSSFSSDFVKQCLRHQVYSSMESIRFAGAPEKFRIEGENELRQCFAVSKGSGTVAITGHLGAWELLAALSPRNCECDFYGLAKPSKNSGLSLVLHEMREKSGTKILWTGQSSLARDMLRVLKGSCVLGAVMDQKPKNRVGPVVHFFNKKTAFVAGPATMAVRAKARSMSFFCIREGFCRYRIVSTPLEDCADKSLEELTQVYASEIEKMIRIYPEQWCWNYKRWNFSEEHVAQ